MYKRQHKYKFKSGVSLQISLTFIDEGGHFTQEVRQHCLARQYDHVFAIKGANRPDIPYTAPPKKQKIVVNGKVIGQVWVYEIGVNAGKQKIVDNLRVQSPGANYCHFPLRDDYGKQFFKQLMSEHLAYVPKPVSYTHLDVYKRQVVYNYDRGEDIAPQTSEAETALAILLKEYN